MQFTKACTNYEAQQMQERVACEWPAYSTSAQMRLSSYCTGPREVAAPLKHPELLMLVLGTAQYRNDIGFGSGTGTHSAMRTESQDKSRRLTL